MYISIFIYVFFMLLNFSVAVAGKKSKVILGLTFAYILILICGNTLNPDRDNYISYYISGWYPEGMEQGYVWLSKTFSSLNISYEMFLCIIMIISTFCYCVILKNFLSYHLFIVLFMAFQIYFDYVQIRCTVAVALFCVGIYFYSKGKKFLYILSILASSLFHKMMLIYFLLLFINTKKKMTYKWLKGLSLIIVFMCIAIFCSNRGFAFLLPYIEKIPFLPMAKITKYFTTQTHGWFLVMAMLQFMNLLIVYFSNNIIQKYSDKNNMRNPEIGKDFSKVVFALALFTNFILPLTLIHGEFIRYIRNYNMLIYILAGVVLELKKKTIGKMYLPINRKYVINLNIYWVALLINIVMWYVLYTPYNINIDIFKYNSLLPWM